MAKTTQRCRRKTQKGKVTIFKALNRGLSLFAISISCILSSGCTDSDPLDMYDEGADIKEPLVRAASEGNLEEVKRLLDAGHDVDAESRSRFTALAIAVRYEYPRVVELLVDNGANVWFIDRYGAYPLEVAVERAEVGENVEIVRALVRGGADPDVKSPGSLQTPREAAKYVGANDLLEAMKKGELDRADSILGNKRG